ncbi:MAG: demethoxyubiquinone hydroxylase family protein [Proteobacteria bacterium]|nr:demethoxyubiquinone hydroxylase family protein [Pseudomonadota bacterium]MDA1323329.1 demethoxyubiquinone hydroxylase family protein [Pseudomonadota bacterium]
MAKKPARTGDGRMPGDPTRQELIESMIRVDHAGEHGAVRIYEGQLAILSGTDAEAPIREMAAQERRHLDGFDALIADRRVRPTLLSPLWHVAGFALGAGTALLGPKAAMACTKAVEEVIDDHYAAQADKLGDDEAELRAMIEEYRTDERAHRDTAVEQGAEDAPGYEILTGAVKAGSRLAIWLSTRI